MYLCVCVYACGCACACACACAHASVCVCTPADVCVCVCVCVCVSVRACLCVGAVSRRLAVTDANGGGLMNERRVQCESCVDLDRGFLTVPSLPFNQTGRNQTAPNSQHVQGTVRVSLKRQPDSPRRRFSIHQKIHSDSPFLQAWPKTITCDKKIKHNALSTFKGKRCDV